MAVGVPKVRRDTSMRPLIPAYRKLCLGVIDLLFDLLDQDLGPTAFVGFHLFDCNAMLVPRQFPCDRDHWPSFMVLYLRKWADYSLLGVKVHASF